MSAPLGAWLCGLVDANRALCELSDDFALSTSVLPVLRVRASQQRPLARLTLCWSWHPSTQVRFSRVGQTRSQRASTYESYIQSFSQYKAETIGSRQCLCPSSRLPLLLVQPQVLGLFQSFDPAAHRRADRGLAAAGQSAAAAAHSDGMHGRLAHTECVSSHLELHPRRCLSVARLRTVRQDTRTHGQQIDTSGAVSNSGNTQRTTWFIVCVCVCVCIVT